MGMDFVLGIILVTHSLLVHVQCNPDRVEEYRRMDFKDRGNPGDFGLNNGIRAHITEAAGCEWGAWSQWTQCSRSCNVGRQDRKQILKPPKNKPTWKHPHHPDDFKCEGKKLHHRHCNKHPCDGGPALPTWVPFTVPPVTKEKMTTTPGWDRTTTEDTPTPTMTTSTTGETPNPSWETPTTPPTTTSTTPGWDTTTTTTTSSGWDTTTTPTTPGWDTTTTTPTTPGWDTTTTTPTTPGWDTTTTTPTAPGWDTTTTKSTIPGWDAPPLVRCKSKKECKGRITRYDVKPPRQMKYCDKGSKKYKQKEGVCNDSYPCKTSKDCVKLVGKHSTAGMKCKKMKSKKSGKKSKVCRWNGKIDKLAEVTTEAPPVDPATFFGAPIVSCKHKKDCSEAKKCLSPRGECIKMKHCDRGPKKQHNKMGICTDKARCHKDSDCEGFGNPTDGLVSMKCQKMKGKGGKIKKLCRWTGEIQDMPSPIPLISCNTKKDCRDKCKASDDFDECKKLVHCDMPEDEVEGICNDKHKCKKDSDCKAIGNLFTTGMASRSCKSQKHGPNRCFVDGGIIIS